MANACKERILLAVDEGADKGDIENVALAVNRVKRANSRYKETGKYADPEKRIKGFDEILEDRITEKYKHLKGKTIEVEDTNGNFKSIKVTNVRGSGRKGIMINDVRYDVDTGISLDGSKSVNVLGSEKVSEEGYELADTAVIQTGNEFLSVVDYMKEWDAAEGKTYSDRYEQVMASVAQNFAVMIENAGGSIKLNVDAMTQITERESEYNRGSADVKTGKIKLMMGSGKFASKMGVFLHETQHVLIEETLRAHPELRQKIKNLRKAMKKELSYEVFLDGIENPTADEVNRAKELFDYAFEAEANSESEFLAYATTDEQLMKALNIEFGAELVGKSSSNGRFAKVWNRIAEAINKIYRSISYKGKTGEAAALNLLQEALELTVKNSRAKEASILGNVSEWLHDADKKVAGMTDKIEENTEEYKKDLVEGIKVRSKLERAVDKLWTIKGLSRARSFILQNKLFMHITTSWTDEDVGKFYDMFRQSKRMIDRAMIEVKGATHNVLMKDYGFEKISEDVRSAYKRVLLDTDMRSIGSIDDVVRVLTNDEEYAREMEEAKGGLKGSTIEAAEALGVMIATNEVGIRNGYINARQIALREEKIEASAVIGKIDKIASLMALKAIGSEDVKLFLENIEKDKSSVEKAMNLYYTNHDKLVEKAYSGNDWNVEKGLRLEHYAKDTKYHIVTEDEMKVLTEKVKMYNMGEHKELSRIAGKKMFIVAGSSMDAGYTEGLMSMVQLKTEGDSLKGVLMQLGVSEDEINGIITNEIISNEKSDNYLVPERNIKGDIVDYKVRVKHDDKYKYLGMSNDLVSTISTTVANLTRKDEAVISNKNTVKYLHKFYEKHKNDSNLKFMEIDKNSTGKLKEYWDSMPGYLKRELKRISGSERIMVEESMLVDFFGYKEASLSNLTSNKRLKLGVLKAEQIVKEIASNWKNVIVTKTGGTIFGNATSNMLVTLQHLSDKNPVAYGKKFTEIWESMNEYQRDTGTLRQLEVRRDAGEKGLEKKINHYKNLIKSNRVHRLVSDGQYTTLLEDIDLADLETKTPIASKIEEGLAKIKDKDKHAKVKWWIDNLYWTNDSKLGQSIRKATMYNDIINRIMIDEDNLATGKMTPDESRRYTDKLFVNYAYLDNKYIKYANDLGFVTFTKYFFRTMPALIKMATIKPVTMFLTESSQYVTGVDLEHPIDQIYNPIDTVIRKLFLFKDTSSVFEDLVTPMPIRLVF